MNGIKISDKTVKQLSASKDFSLSFKEKIEVAKLLDKLCVDVIELDEMKNQRVDPLLVKSIVTAVKYSTVAVPVALGTDAAIVANALAEAKKFRLQVAAPASSVRMEYVYHKKPAAILEAVKTTVADCRKYTDDVEFIADDATRSDMSFLSEMINAAIEAGATTVTLCDDAGSMLPAEFGAFVKEAIDAIPALNDIKWGVSCSDEITMADACVIEGVTRGALEVKTSTVSGETASLANVARVIVNKGQAFGVTTGVQTASIKRTVAQISKICMGENNVFDASTHKEIAEEEILTIHDDKEAVIKVVNKLGYDLSEDDGDAVFEAFKRIAAKKEKVTSRDLDAIVATNAMQVPSRYKLESYIANTGNKIASMVHVILEDGASTKDGISVGAGPIDAAFLAIEQIIGRHFELDDFQIRAVTEGKEAAGEAIVKLRSEGKVYSGKGLSTDIIGASIRAYLNALNKIVYEEEEA